ncbi:MAG TPA: hypothetical protein PKY82_31980 [Pyrinomonadaceae bacterium]|nr:hypothetical protein [Pyrinomonadaceae bacterium]
MKKQMLAIIFILFPLVSFYAQETDSESLKKGSEIIINARLAIGLDEIKVNSFHFKIKQVMTQKANVEKPPIETTSEITSILPDKIQSIIFLGLGSEATHIWNGEKYKSFLVMDLGGNRTVKDTTNQNKSNNGPSDETLKSLEGKIDKRQLDFLKNIRNAKRPDPKLSLIEDLWTNLFPLTLSHPFEPDLQFKYIGKAESKGQFANIVEVKSKSGKTYRLFFDSITNYLLMMTYGFSSNSGEVGGMFDGDREFKYYFSNRQKFGNILVPKQIKSESIFKPLGSSEIKQFYSTYNVEEFSINPDLKESLFEIK